MTISSTVSRWEYDGDAATTVFTYTNKIFADTDLEVYSDNVLQTLATQYTVSGVGVETGGAITYLTAPANGVKVVIIRVVADTQETKYPVGGSLPSGVIEDDIDRRTILSQQKEEKLSRAILTPSGEEQMDMTLPVIATRASKYLGFDSGGQPVELDAPAGTTTASTFGAKVILAADYAAAQDLLNIAASVTTAGTLTAYTLVSNETIVGYDDGAVFGIDFHVTCGAAPTIDIDGQGVKALVWPNGTALAAGDVVTGQKALMAYDGTDMVVLSAGGNAAARTVGTATAVDLPTAADIQGQAATAFNDSGAADAYVITPVPAITAYAKYQFWQVDIANANTGASTMNISGLGARNIFDYNTGAALTGGELVAGLHTFMDDGTQLILMNPKISSSLTLETEQATTSGTAKDFTGISSSAKKITVMIVGVSVDGTSNIIIQLGDSGGFETSGYNGSAAQVPSGGQAQISSGFNVTITPLAANVLHGMVTLTLEDSSDNTWVASGMVGHTNINGLDVMAGSKALSAVLTQIRLTTVNGTDAFDAGAVNILIET